MALERVEKKAALQKAPDRKHVLYVEDEDQNWELAEFALRDRYGLSRARDARQAIDLLRTEQFQAIMMDIQLSGSDFSGIDLTKILRGTLTDNLPRYAAGFPPIDLPIIFVSAYNARYTREDLLACGGDEMIPKPVDFTRLSLALSMCIMRRLQGSLRR